jgi:hypothetical protein
MNRLWYLIFALLLLCIILILTRPVKEITDLKPYETAIRIADQEIKELKQSNLKLQAKIDSDSLRQTKEKETYRTEVKKRDAVIAKLKGNPTIIRIREENPEVDSLIVAQDSLITRHAERVAELESNLTDLRVDMKALVNNFNSEIAAHISKYENEKKIADTYQKENRKIRRSSRLWKAATVTAGVLGLFVGSGL